MAIAFVLSSVPCRDVVLGTCTRTHRQSTRTRTRTRQNRTRTRNNSTCSLHSGDMKRDPMSVH